MKQIHFKSSYASKLGARFAAVPADREGASVRAQPGGGGGCAQLLETRCKSPIHPEAFLGDATKKDAALHLQLEPSWACRGLLQERSPYPAPEMQVKPEGFSKKIPKRCELPMQGSDITVSERQRFLTVKINKI